tara:strand:- start:156 stop:362 length:207 start_codon:yes stop_codon:yes gene_type:complete
LDGFILVDLRLACVDVDQLPLGLRTLYKKLGFLCNKHLTKTLNSFGARSLRTINEIKTQAMSILTCYG